MVLKSLFKVGQNEDILNSHPDGLIIVNFQKEIVFWNKRAAEIFGYTKKEALGKNIAFIIEGGVKNIYKTLGFNKSAVLRGKTKVGHEIYVEVTSSDTPNADEVIVAVRNVTQRHTAIESVLDNYEKEKQANFQKNDFIANLSYDLKNPVQSIIGFSQALIDGLGGELSEKQAKYISIINRNANGLVGLVSSLVDIAKLEAEKMEFKFKTFDLYGAINQVAEVIAPKASEKALSFAVDTDDLVKKNCFSDENMVKRVLMNVLDNAVKYTDTGAVSMKVTHPDLDFVRYQGVITPDGAVNSMYVMFSITDTGVGIEEDELNSIFDQYRKVDRTNKKQAGAGLGLAIARKIIEELGGVIWVESGIGKGSAFNIILPIERNETNS